MKFFSRFFFCKLLGLFVLILGVMTAFASFAPKNFPVGSEVHIAQNSSLSDISDLLAGKDVISSAFLFKVIITSLHAHRIVAGDYLFSKQENLWIVANRFAEGDQQLIPVKVTIPEGSTVRDIASILLKKMPNFNAPYFIKIAHDYEGYLFPDTYLFSPHESPDNIFKTLRDTFDAKIADMTTDIRLSHHTQKDIVIMASLLEKEASSTNDRLIISGILWKRIGEGIPLQVDASLVYITGHTSPSVADTKIDSPYNTYKYPGLPKGPISNPGLDALTAAEHPVTSTYYYYLSDAKGNMHYANTYDEHLANRRKYLK